MLHIFSVRQCFSIVRTGSFLLRGMRLSGIFLRRAMILSGYITGRRDDHAVCKQHTACRSQKKHDPNDVCPNLFHAQFNPRLFFQYAICEATCPNPVPPNTSRASTERSGENSVNILSSASGNTLFISSRVS